MICCLDSLPRRGQGNSVVCASCAAPMPGMVYLGPDGDGRAMFDCAAGDTCAPPWYTPWNRRGDTMEELLAKYGKVKALFLHPGTPEAEKKNAQRQMERMERNNPGLAEAWKAYEDALGKAKVGPGGGPVDWNQVDWSRMDEAELKRVLRELRKVKLPEGAPWGDRVAKSVFDKLADYVLDTPMETLFSEDEMTKMKKKKPLADRLAKALQLDDEEGRGNKITLFAEFELRETLVQDLLDAGPEEGGKALFEALRRGLESGGYLESDDDEDTEDEDSSDGEEE